MCMSVFAVVYVRLHCSGSLQGLLVKRVEQDHFQTHSLCVLHCSLLKSSDRAWYHLLICVTQKQVLFDTRVVIQSTTKGMCFSDMLSKYGNKFFK